jgi:hypothetical protein
MNFKINTVEEAWDFLINEVYSVNKGEFRIHTNKDGIRLYLKFSNEKYTGRIYQYHLGVGSKYHEKLRFIREKVYCDTLVDVGLVNVLNKHLERMSGNILFDDDYIRQRRQNLTNEMTPEEFILNDLKERRQESQFEERLKQLKEIYKF